MKLKKINKNVILKWKIVLGLGIAQAKGLEKFSNDQSSNTAPGVSFCPVFSSLPIKHTTPPYFSRSSLICPVHRKRLTFLLIGGTM